jgi:GYF domain 2
MTDSHYYVTKNQEIQGPYTPEEIQARVKSGYFLNTDLAWQQGESQWQAIADLLPSPSPTASKKKKHSLMRRKFSGFARTSFYIGIVGILLWLMVFLPGTVYFANEPTDSLLRHTLRILKYICMGISIFGVGLSILAMTNKYSSKTRAIYGFIFNSVLLVMYWVLLDR